MTHRDHQLSFQDRQERVRELAADPSAKVMVFIDGQNLFKRCQDFFNHALCHPYLLAELLAGPRTPQNVSTRFYTGEPDRNIDEIENEKQRRLRRRLSAIRRCGVTTITRDLRYHWTWGPARDQLKLLGKPGPTTGTMEVWMDAYQRPREKGIDLAIGLEVIEFALSGLFDVAIIVSYDADLHEIPRALKNMRHHLPKPVRVEAAVPIPPRRKKPLTLPAFDYTHQITSKVFEVVKDDTNYGADDWTRPVLPCSLGDLP